ncbi:TRAP transporter large permease [Oscillibacter sp.]|jgi:C4-dicarboxylate transporter DctM subunit|uniref:TRAP transporter large permease n=1 Tax=Oscillibacter sp. TaxID=1945593 RepID=UPI002170167E|nr:TRAP transporter large permease [Oscillibacter sp.]MCI9239682.1 TRAP transporter large permease [Oscillibacter sp.]
MNSIAVILVLFFVFLFLNVPICVSIGLTCAIYSVTYGGVNPSYIATSMFTSCDSFPLMAVPFFILAGALMEGGGLSKRLVNLGDSLLGHFTGGFAIVTVATCAFFGAISGSAPATVAAIGSIMVPTMIERGYDRDFSLALIAASGCLGILIPPSIPMVVYGVSTNTSIGGMFLGGFGPGILTALLLVGMAIYISHKRGFKGNGLKFSLRRVWKEFVAAIWAILVPVIILGGIYGGIFTPTEAAAVAVIYGFFAGTFIYKELTWGKFRDAVMNSCVTVGNVLIIVGTATTLGRVFTVENLPALLSNMIGGLDSSLVILLIINLLLLVVGCIMETSAAIMILAPILLPLVAKFGVNPIHFGLIMVLNLAIGMITPPVGCNLFVAAGLAKTEFMRIVRAVLPLLFVMLIGLILVTYAPPITLTLPKLLGFVS